MAGAPTLDIDDSLLGSLELEGPDVAYVNLQQLASIPTRLRAAGIEYAYERSFPISGHSAVLPDVIAELDKQERRVLVAERRERYLLYVA